SSQNTTPTTINSSATKSESKVVESTGPKETKKPEFEQPKAQDWRKSWGKMDSSQEKTNITKSQPVEHELPHADRTKPDPLKSVDYLHPKLEEKIAKKAVKAVGRESSNQEVEAIVSGGNFPKTTAELAEKSTPKTTPTETIKVAPKEKPKSIPVAKINANTKIKTETVETTAALPIIVIKEPRQPRIVFSKKKEPTEAKTPDFLGRTMGRIYGFLDKPKEINVNEEKVPPGNGSVIAAGAPPVRVIPYIPNGQPLGAPPTAHNFIPPQAPQLYPSYPNTRMAGNSYPTQGMANAFTSVPNQRPIPSDVESTVAMQNAFNPTMPKEGDMPAQGFSPQGINPNNDMARSMASGQMPANMMAYIQPESNVIPADTFLMENVVMLKNANQPSQREYAADQLSKIRGVSMNLAVQALATAVKEDPAPLVRAACIRSLTRMKINTIEVLEVINEKKTDLDPRVRMEADQAIIQLTSGSSESGNKIRQTGSTFKR
ncbi:MAG: HEAT repeat domain-containing protein, partial [Planctomycetota bacterium]